MGAAAALAFAWLGAKALQRPLFDRWGGADGAMRAIAVGSVVTLVTLDLLGVNRGEVTRLWIFLTPLAQATVPYGCRRQLGHAAYLVIVAGAVMQAALSATTVGFMIE